MNAQEQQGSEERLRGVLTEAYPATEPPEELMRRVGQAAAQSQERHRRRRQWRTALALTGVTALSVMAVIITPRLVAAQTLYQMQNAINDARSVHSIDWRVAPDGGRVQTAETWYQEGRWRIEQGGGRRTEICAGGRCWRYVSATDTVTLERQARPSGYQGMTGFSIGAGVRDAALIGVLMDIRVIGRTVVNGRPAHQIVMRDNKYPADRMLLTVDDASDLPIRGESQHENRGRWATQGGGEMYYNERLPDTLFEPNFPKTARVIDVEAGRGVWERKLSQGIAARKFSDISRVYLPQMIGGRMQIVNNEVRKPRLLVVRDLQVNSLGDVFVLFTDNDYVGSGGQFGSADLEDDLGTRYLPAPTPPKFYAGTSDVIPTCYESDGQGGNRVDGYTFGGEPLEGTWWVPLTPQQGPWKPRRFRLTFHLRDPGSVNPVVLSLPVQKPTAAIVPEYMPYMARPLFENTVRVDEALRRAHFYQEASDLPTALTWYRASIAVKQADDRQIQGHYDESDEWWEMFQILTTLGRTEEAKQALLRANENAVYASPTRDRIRDAMGKLGLQP